MDDAAPVAQLDRALPSEGKGHTFESCRVRQLFPHRRAQTGFRVRLQRRIDPVDDGKWPPDHDRKKLRYAARDPDVTSAATVSAVAADNVHPRWPWPVL